MSKKNYSRIAFNFHLIWNSANGNIHEKDFYLGLWFIQYGLSAVKPKSHTELCICEFTERKLRKPPVIFLKHRAGSFFGEYNKSSYKRRHKKKTASHCSHDCNEFIPHE